MFDLGEICPTRLVTSRSNGLGVDLMGLLLKHTDGDWGNLTPTEIKWNYIALEDNRPIFSRYSFGTNVFIIYTNQVEGFTEIKMGDEVE